MVASCRLTTLRHVCWHNRRIQSRDTCRNGRTQLQHSDGERMQKGNTNKMIFNVEYIVSYLSQFMTLNPGDIITTGTPPGVGMARNPQLFLKNGDEMILKIDHLGFQKQKVS